MFNSQELTELRRLFPMLEQAMHGVPLVYLDNAATTQKPLPVLEAMEQFYRFSCANVHRGIYELSYRATEAYEGVREVVRRFLNARDPGEIVFTKSCTEAINLVAHSYGRLVLRPGDELLVSIAEHHSNIVPWQLIASHTGASIRPIPVDDEGRLDLEAYHSLLSGRVKIVAVAHVSNVLGTVTPLESIIKGAHRVGARVLVDGAQSAAHLQIDVAALDVDFYCLSGHKFYGPTGTGVLYGKRELLDSMPPYQGGGDMIRSVSFDGTTYDESPGRFEAGTPNIAGVIGLGAALRFLEEVGFDRIAAHETVLLKEAEGALRRIEGVRILGATNCKTSIVSFTVEGVHPHDVGTVLDHEGVAVRSGHHCCMPLMQRLGIPGTSRASFALYNTLEEVDVFVRALRKVKEVFRER